MRNLIHWLAVALLGFCAGCATSFRYTPSHGQTYAVRSEQLGLAIRTGEDSRLANEIQPPWAENAEKYIARAVRDEVEGAKLFHRVKIHVNDVNPKRYSTTVQFRILKFDCVSQAGILETTGKNILRFQGVRGALIAKSIPTKYISEVTVEFSVQDAVTQTTLMSQTYSATREVPLNGYQSDEPKVAQTSAALESVVTRFVVDLAKIVPHHQN